MQPTGPPTQREIWTIARRTINIINVNTTLNACLFGSAACSLWADIGRVPHDVDIVVTSDFNESLDAEEIKEFIAEADDRYFLWPSKFRSATYQILFCRLPGWKADRRCVKVDILVPPTLELPQILSSDIISINYISVMPLFDLLVMKTRGWWDHYNSSRPGSPAKERAEVSDIYALLDCAKGENVSYNDEAYEYRHQDGFMDLARDLSRRFVNVYGGYREWRNLGFPV